MTAFKEFLSLCTALFMYIFLTDDRWYITNYTGNVLGLGAIRSVSSGHMIDSDLKWEYYHILLPECTTVR